MSRILHDEQLSAKLDAFFDAGRDLAKELVSTWLASQAGDQAETSPAPVISDKRELSTQELADRWGVSTRSIYEWKTTGGLPFKKRGRLLRFDPIKVDQWEKGRQELFTRSRLRVVR